VIETDDDLNFVLANLDTAAQRDQVEGLHLRRNIKVFAQDTIHIASAPTAPPTPPCNIKVFGQDTIHIVKPAERRFWTRSAAYNDADEIVARLLLAAHSVVA
jgi:hypothetical protein